MNTYDELAAYSAASVTVDGFTRYEVRHYGGNQLWRFWQQLDGEGNPTEHMREDADGPVWLDGLDNSDREPVAPRVLRPLLFAWVLDADPSDELADLRDAFGDSGYGEFRARFGEWLATAGALERSFSEDARILCERGYTGEGEDGPQFDTNDERAAASILWNLAGLACGRCGDDAQTVAEGGAYIAFRSPVYVYNTAPLCPTCAERVAVLHDERGDR